MKDDEEPEYGDLTYLAMVWCAGVAIGLIFYGASEPLFHLKDGTNRGWDEMAVSRFPSKFPPEVAS